jgi:hypothetical protein
MSPEAMMHKYSEGSDAWAFGTLLSQWLSVDEWPI